LPAVHEEIPLPVSSLNFTNLGPFDEIGFEFDSHVNVFVGPNNCGKTTALLALADILVYPFSVPNKLLRGDSEFHARFNRVAKDVQNLKGPYPIIGARGAGGHWTSESFKRIERLQGQLGYRTFVPALRLSTDFRSPGPTTAVESPRPTLPHSVSPKPAILLSTREKPEEMDPSFVRDERIIQRLVDLDYRAYREEKLEIRETINRVANLASRITEGFPIDFIGIGEDRTGLFPRFRTLDGEVPLNFLSQGTQALIQWCAQLLIGYAEFYDFPKSLDRKPGILVVDEIDAHLHPSWQRRILSTITEEFPNLQIFCSTHSPLMLAGLKAGQIHLLRRDANGKVIVSRNESDVLGWSADEIYTSLLGVEPTDVATTMKLERVRDLRQKEARLTRAEKAELASLRDELHDSLTQGLLNDQASLFAGRLQHAASESVSGKRKRTSRKKATTSSKRSTTRTASKRPGGSS
jgi:ABC-type multidrug transport system ATPase subunit